MADTAEDIVAAARGIVVERCPYLSHILFSVRPVPMEGLGTFAVGKDWVMFYDPAKALEWQPISTAAVVFHELCHVLREHFDRLEAQRADDPWGVNAACMAEGTKVLMADGSEKPIEKVQIGEVVWGADGLGVVLNSFSKTVAEVVETVTLSDSAISTPDHRFLTEDGYVEAEKIPSVRLVRRTRSLCSKTSRNDVFTISSQIRNETDSGVVSLPNKEYSNQSKDDASVDKTRGEVRPRQLSNCSNERISKVVGTIFCKCNEFSALVGDLQRSENSKTIQRRCLEEATPRSYCLSGGHSGRRGNGYDNQSQQQQIPSAKNLSHQYEYGLSKLDASVGVCQSTCSICEQKEALLGAVGQWTDYCRHPGIDGAVFDCQKETSPFSPRIYKTSGGPAEIRCSDPENEEHSSGNTQIAFERFHQRRIRKQTTVWDLTTTCHSYVANGFVVHNCDREINDDVVQANFVLPGQPLMPHDIEMPNGLTAEAYYRKSETEPKPSAPGCGGKCGSCAGNPTEGEGNGEGGLSDTDKQVTLLRTAQEIKEYTKSYGHVPSGLRAWADAKLKPAKVDWRKRLAALVRNSLASTAGACDFTWRKIGRRSLHSAGRTGWPLAPAYRRPIPNVGVVLDTSGSMYGNSIAIALSETLGIAKAVGGGVKVYACDAAVHKVATVMKESDLERVNAGGGGTSMRPGFLAARMGKADLVVILTDGIMGQSDWPTPDECRGTRTLAVICGGQHPPSHVPFVEVN
jgi:predicted metal-dependent peptidase